MRVVAALPRVVLLVPVVPAFLAADGLAFCVFATRVLPVLALADFVVRLLDFFAEPAAPDLAERRVFDLEAFEGLADFGEFAELAGLAVFEDFEDLELFAAFAPPAVDAVRLERTAPVFFVLRTTLTAIDTSAPPCPERVAAPLPRKGALI